MPDLKNLDVEWVSLVDRAAVRDPSDTDQPMRFLVWKREGEPSNKGGGMPTDEEMRAALAKAEQERDQLKADLEKAQADQATQTEALEKAQADIEALKKGDEPEAAKVDKADLPEAVRVELEKGEADRKELAERLEKAEKLAKSERDERLSREFLAKAESFEALTVKADDLAPVLKVASEALTSEQYETLEGVLKAADAQVKESDLFKEQGRSGSTADTGALAEAAKKADELRKADSTLSQAQALQKAIDSDRDLQERYLAEVRA